MHPKHLLIDDFSYNLPVEKIARYPLPERDGSKLLVYKNGKIETSTYKNLHRFVPANSLLVFNDTRVVEARLLFQKPTGAIIEIFCLEPSNEDETVAAAMLQKGKARWKCLIGGASKWKHGLKLLKVVRMEEVELMLEAAIVDRLKECFIIELSWQPENLSFAEVLHLTGVTPLPPYLHRDSEEQDSQRYQTIYAHNSGSVAAPTAGLHFTEAVFDTLSAKNIEKEFVTLHVGAGTFKPVKGNLSEHEMHAEFIDVSADNIKRLIKHLEKTIVAVGTTSLRTIESLFWMGVKVLKKDDIHLDQLTIQQWEPYDMQAARITAGEALAALLNWMSSQGLSRIITKTQILIAPPYQLKIAKGIITNFHQPNSTLLLLIAAIVGNDWRNIYEFALNNDYRFLSYGDGCLLWQTP